MKRPNSNYTVDEEFTQLNECTLDETILYLESAHKACIDRAKKAQENGFQTDAVWFYAKAEAYEIAAQQLKLSNGESDETH